MRGGRGAVGFGEFGNGAAGHVELLLFGAGRVFCHGDTGARAEDETFEEGIAGEAIGAMDAGGSGFTGSVKAGDGGASPKIGFDAAHYEVRGGTDGSEVAGKIEAIAEARGVDAWETLFEELLGLGGHVEIDMLAVGFVHFADDGARDDIARSKLLSFVVALHEAFEMDIAEDATFAAECFAEEESRGAFDGESGGMELHEFHVGEHGASFVGDGHAITGGDIGIGGFTVELAEPAGGEENGASADFVERVIGFVEEANADDAAVFENEFGGEGVGAQVEMRDGVGAGEKGAADFAAGGIAVGVEDAGTAVSGFAGEGELGAGAIKFGAPIDELSDVLGTFFDEESDYVGAAKAVAGVEGVLLVEADFVFVAEGDGDAALGVGGGGFGEIGLGEDENSAGLAEFNCGAHAGDSGTDDEVIGLVGFCGVCHVGLLEAQKYGSTGGKEFSVFSYKFCV